MTQEVEFLMKGDPAIRWQTLRDLLDAPESEWQAERSKVSAEGWGAAILSHRGKDGTWPEARWTGDVWTLIVLTELGIDLDGRTAFDRLVGRLLPKGAPVARETLFQRMDICHLGFWLRIGSSFCPKDERLSTLIDFLLSVQMEDGGWNCRIRVKPKTFNVLEGLRAAHHAGLLTSETFRGSEARAIEFMLQHRLYRSDKTGEVVEERFLNLTFPSYWHYNILRGLDYIRQTPFRADPRLSDPLDVLESRRKTNGLWPVERRIPGETLFDMEKMGGDSRWVTLKALRILRGAGRL